MAGPQLSVELTGDEVKLFKALQKIVGQNKRLEDSFGQVRSNAKKASDEASKGFGTQALGQIRNYAAGVFSVAAAMRVMGDAMRYANDEIQKAQGLVKGLDDANRGLAQIAQSPEELKSMYQRADSAAMRFGVERAAARQMLFSAYSEGFQQDYERILGMRSLIDPQAAAGVAGQAPKLFNDQITPMQSVSGLLTAASGSRANFEQLARVLPTAAAGGGMLGSSAEETMASLGVLTGRTASPEQAATLIGGFGTTMSLNDQFAGKGFLETVRELQAMSPEQRRGILGTSQELNKAFTLFSEEMDNITAEAAKVRKEMELAGSDQGILNQRMQNRMQIDAEHVADMEAMRSRLGREVAQTGASIKGFQTEAAKDQVLRDMLNDPNSSPLDRFVAETMMNATRFGGGGEQAVNTAGTMGGMVSSAPGNFDLWNPVLVGRKLDRIGDLLQEGMNRQKPQTLAEPDADR